MENILKIFCDERTSSPVSSAGVAYGATRVAKPWTASEALAWLARPW